MLLQLYLEYGTIIFVIRDRTGHGSEARDLRTFTSSMPRSALALWLSAKRPSTRGRQQQHLVRHKEPAEEQSGQ